MPRGNVIFQALIFTGRTASFREGNLNFCDVLAHFGVRNIFSPSRLDFGFLFQFRSFYLFQTLHFTRQLLLQRSNPLWKSGRGFKKKKCFSKNWIPIWPNGIIFQQPRFPGKNMGSRFPSNLLHFRVRSYEIAIIWSERKHENTPSFSPRSWSFHQISLGIEKKLPHQGKPNPLPGIL